VQHRLTSFSRRNIPILDTFLLYYFLSFNITRVCGDYYNTTEERKCHVSPLPTLPDIARVQTIKILGVTISDRLSVNQHVTNVIASSAQRSTLYRSFELMDWTKTHSMEFSRRLSLVIARLTYACPAWWGFTTANDRQKKEAVIRRGLRFDFCSTNQAPLAELAATADETLFENILHNKQYVLCCRTERSQPTTFAQKNMTVHLQLNIQ